MFWGEIIRQIAYNKVGVNEENSYIVVSICLVFLSVILTGFQVYEPLAKWCGSRNISSDHRICELGCLTSD